MNDVNKIIKINYYIIIIVIIVIIDLISLFLLFIFNGTQNHSVIDSINIDLLDEAALNYLDLPEQEVMITLKTMYEEQLILPLIDSKNNKCNEVASYVKITNQKNKYKVDNVLICGMNTYNRTHYVRGR